MSKPFVCKNDETAEVEKAGDNEVEECALVHGGLNSVLGYQGTLVSLRLPRSGVSLWLPRCLTIYPSPFVQIWLMKILENTKKIFHPTKQTKMWIAWKGCMRLKKLKFCKTNHKRPAWKSSQQIYGCFFTHINSVIYQDLPSKRKLVYLQNSWFGGLSKIEPDNRRLWNF